MFKLIALLFLVTNGVSAEEPWTSIPNKMVFPSEEACKTFIDSDEGKLSKARLEEILASQSAPSKAKLTCVQGEDNSL
jgi:hypothetical protein